MESVLTSYLKRNSPYLRLNTPFGEDSKSDIFSSLPALCLLLSFSHPSCLRLHLFHHREDVIWYSFVTSYENVWGNSPWSCPLILGMERNPGVCRTLTTSDCRKREEGWRREMEREKHTHIFVHLHISCAEQKSPTISKRSLFLQNSSQRGKIRICINFFIFILSEHDFRQICI